MEARSAKAQKQGTQDPSRARSCSTGPSGQQWRSRWEGADLACGQDQLALTSELSVVSNLIKNGESLQVFRQYWGGLVGAFCWPVKTIGRQLDGSSNWFLDRPGLWWMSLILHLCWAAESSSLPALQLTHHSSLATVWVSGSSSLKGEGGCDQS